MSKKTEEPQDRIYNNEVVFDSDLYKLKNAFLKKNTQWQPEAEPEYVSIEHNHWYHSYDSDGRKLDHSIERCGHFHVMTVEAQKKGPPKVTCSGPMKWVMNKRKQKIAAPLGEHDTHVHEAQYIRSHKLKMRQANAEAAKVHAIEQMKAAPIPGVNG